MKLKLLGTSLVTVAGFLFATSALRAATIFQDSFNGTGELNGQTPTVTTGGATWAGTTGVYTEGGGVATYTNTTNTGPNFAVLAYAGTSLANGVTYTLSLDTTLAATGDLWNGIGFSTSATGGDAFGNGAAWMLNKGTGSDIQYFANNFGQSGTATSAGSSATTLSIQLAIDGAGAGSLSYFSNGVLLNGATPISLTSGQVDGIQGVGFFKYHDAAGTYDNFTFSDNVAVPEPSSWVMMIGGCLFLVALRVRARSRKVV